MMKKLLLTGASGFLGWNISKFVQTDWQILGTYFKNKEGVHSNIKADTLDLRNAEAVDDFFKNNQIEGIVHAAALSSPNDCAKMPELSFQVNVKATEYLAIKAMELDIPFIFTSSSQVFDGNDAPYSESDTPSAISTYAKHKIEGEQAVAKANKEAVILRMPLMYGQTSPSSKNFLNDWLGKMQRGELLKVFTDEYRTALSGQSAAWIIFEILKKEIKGELFHLGGKERLSRAEFAFLMDEIFEPKAPNIEPCLQSDFRMTANRPKDLSMNIDKLKGAIDFQPKSIRDEFLALKG